MGFRRIHFIAVFLLGFLWAQSAPAQNLQDRVIEHRLKNGLVLLLLERHGFPTVATSIRVKAGGVDELPGSTGLAHMVEHMLFKGTKTVGTRDFEKEKPLLEQIQKLGNALDQEERRGNSAEVPRLKTELKRAQEEHRKLIVKDEFARIYGENGGVGYNASTSKDLTTYIVSLPANRLELWARLEADRMANPVLREFFTERDVVLEERRRGVESVGSSRLYQEFLAASFQAHPYRLPVIGWESDVRWLTPEKLSRFLQTYYVPNNAVIAIVGDINPREVIDLIEKYFGPIPAGPTPPPVVLEEPPQRGERRVQVVFEAEPSIYIGYHKPNIPAREDYVFDVIDALLTDGRTSRLYRTLVEDKKIAYYVSTSPGTPGARYPNLFVLRAAPRYPHTTRELEEGIYAEIEKLQRELVTPRELEKIRNRLEVNFLRGLRSNSGLASQISYFQTITGDWRYILNHRRILGTVTPEEIREVARKYLIPENRTVAELLRPKRSDGPKP